MIEIGHYKFCKYLFPSFYFIKTFNLKCTHLGAKFIKTKFIKLNSLTFGKPNNLTYRKQIYYNKLI